VMKVAFSNILYVLLLAPAWCWNGKGHEVVAYIAYQHLDTAARTKVDELLKRNPCYGEWVSAVSTWPEAERPVGLSCWQQRGPMTSSETTTQARAQVGEQSSVSTGECSQKCPKHLESLQTSLAQAGQSSTLIHLGFVTSRL
jgi:S1/P1 Nuclease